MELRFKYYSEYWIAFIVGFALLGLAILCRVCVRRRGMTTDNKPQKGQPMYGVDDQASIDSENSETKDLESANGTLSSWFRRSNGMRAHDTAHSMMIINQRSTGTSTTQATIASRQDSVIGTHGSSQRRVNQCATASSMAVTPRISPENPLHSQRGLHRSKFTFDEPPAESTQQLGMAEGMIVTGSVEIVRSRSWEQSIRRWTAVILAWNSTDALDQSETIV